MHAATDFPCPVGTPVYAVHAGVVVTRAWLGNGGYSVEIDGGGVRARYMHLSGFRVEMADSVAPGRLVALSGNTGSASLGPHLHLAVWFRELAEAFKVQPDPYATQGWWAVDPERILGRMLTDAQARDLADAAAFARWMAEPITLPNGRIFARRDFIMAHLVSFDVHRIVWLAGKA